VVTESLGWQPTDGVAVAQDDNERHAHRRPHGVDVIDYLASGRVARPGLAVLLGH